MEGAGHPGERQPRERCRWDGETAGSLISQSNKNSSSKRDFPMGFALEIRICITMGAPPRRSPRFPPPAGCHPFPDTFAEPLQNSCRRGPEPHGGGLPAPPPFPSSLCRAPKAAFTKYGRVFFCLPVFGTPAAAQERSFPDAEVSPALLHPSRPSPLSPSPAPIGRGVMLPPPNSPAPLDIPSAAGTSRSTPKITVIGVWGEREAREKGAQWWHPLASLPICG